MNTQTHLVACGFAVTTLSSAMAGMNGLSFDSVGENSIDGATTYRVYAELDSGNRLDAVYGGNEFDIRLEYLDGASAYQNALGGPTSQSVNSAFFPLAPDLEWDSYFTIGSLYTDGTPFGNNALQDIGINWSTWDPGLGDLFADNGTFFITPDEPQGEEQNGRVLIAQFTTFTGGGVWDIYFSAGFQGKDADGTTWQSGYDIFLPGAIPTPGGVVLVGLAGVCGRRRRQR
ncbi:MAG: hypothetical protein QGH76_06955 [Phycisphaerales bacterium]|nr:hypothetical protein [Phycisphaerales bacterium]